MKRTLIATLAVLACALLVCAGSLAALNGTVDTARRLREEAVQAAGAGDLDRARAQMAALAEYWAGRAGLMELLASHDDLHDVDAAIADARICIARGDAGEFLRAMSTVDMGLLHLRDEEAVRWANLY